MSSESWLGVEKQRSWCPCLPDSASCPRLCGSSRNRRRLTDVWHSVLYTAVAVSDTLFCSTICVLSIVDAVGADENRDGNEAYKPMAYSIMALYCLVAFLFFSLDGVWGENSFQLIASLGTSALFLSWTVISTYETAPGYGDVWLDWSFTVMVVRIVSTSAYLLLARPIYVRFGWNAFKSLGTADVDILRFYHTFYRFCSCLKIDFVLCVLLVLLGALLVFGFRDPRTFLCVGAAGASFVFLLVAWYGATRESRTRVGGMNSAAASTTLTCRW